MKKGKTQQNSTQSLKKENEKKMLPYFGAGFDTEGLSSAVWPGGETEALTRLERHLERKVSERQILPSNQQNFPI